MAVSGHGYSGKPLYQKLGLKPGMRCLIVAAPATYRALVDDAEGVRFLKSSRSPVDAVHLFCPLATGLSGKAEKAISALVPGGMLWVSWPKKSSPLFRDLTEDQVRAAILPMGWVDTKVCAVNDDWSALKFLKRRVP